MDAPFTAYYDTPNKSPRQNVPRRGVVLHHAALTSLDYLRRLCMGEKLVSATGICKDENLERMMSDGWRPWSLSDGFWDSALRSVETANESTIGWTISDASHWKLAQGVAYWATIDGFWPHRDGDPTTWTVIGHREVYTIHGGSYATACPGGMDLELVTERAQAILNGTAPAGGGYEQIKEIKVKHIHVEDRRTTVLEPGKNTVSKNAQGAPQHVLGEVGPYSITPHVYAKGEPGDALDLTLEWASGSPTRFSPHYAERLVADRNGIIRASREYKRALAAGQTVVLRVTAPATNLKPVTVTVLDCDSYLFTVA